MDEKLKNLKNNMDDTILKPGEMSTFDKRRFYNSAINHMGYTRRDYFAQTASAILVVTFLMFFGSFIIQNMKSEITDIRNAETPQSIIPNNQNDPELKIGVIGKSPEVKENRVQFEEIDLKDLARIEIDTKYDGIIIMKDFLSEAAKSQYAEVYKTSGVPFFFIQSEKTYIPFIDEKVEYDEFPNTDTQEYATGYYQDGEDAQFWGYGLYNDKQTDENIKDVYTRIFKTISNIEDK